MPRFRLDLCSLIHNHWVADMLPKANNLSASPALESKAETTPTHRWYTHSYNRPIVYRLVTTCAPWMPRPIRLGLARTIAPIFQRLMPQEYSAARHNMTRILPHADDTKIDRTVQMLFRNFASVFSDLLSLNRQALSTQQRYQRHVHGLEHLQEVLASPRGFVAATAHIGNWELAGRLLLSFGRPLYVLMAPEQHAAVQRLLRDDDQPEGLHFVTNESNGGFVQLLMALRRGAIVAVQADRVTGHRSDVAVPFFGTPARFPGGPFTLAAAAQVPVLPCFCVLRPDHQYDIYVDPTITVSRGHEDVAVREMVRVLEHYITRAPDQWFNFYDFWNCPST